MSAGGNAGEVGERIHRRVHALGLGDVGQLLPREVHCDERIEIGISRHADRMSLLLADRPDLVGLSHVQSP